MQRSTRVLKLCPRVALLPIRMLFIAFVALKQFVTTYSGAGTVVYVVKRNCGCGPICHLGTEFVAFDSYGSTDSEVLRSCRGVGSRTWSPPRLWPSSSL